jgi:hypothetical protein
LDAFERSAGRASGFSALGGFMKVQELLDQPRLLLGIKQVNEEMVVVAMCKYRKTDES